MDVCIEAGKDTYIHYMDTHEYMVIDEGAYTISALPLIPVPAKGKKSFKEFFHIVRGLSAEDQEQARSAMNATPPNIALLPVCLRPKDALGDSCRLQDILDYSDPASCCALKFFHSNVDIPLGLARTFSDDNVLVINYKLAGNSDNVKKGFLEMMSQIRGEQWLTQKLKHKAAGSTNPKGQQFVRYGWGEQRLGTV